MVWIDHFEAKKLTLNLTRRFDQKVNECFLGPPIGPNGSKLDMNGPEGSLNPVLRVRNMSDGLLVEILNF